MNPMKAVLSISTGWPARSYKAMTKWKKFDFRRLLGGCFSKCALPIPRLWPWWESNRGIISNSIINPNRTLSKRIDPFRCRLVSVSNSTLSPSSGISSKWPCGWVSWYPNVQITIICFYIFSKMRMHICGWQIQRLDYTEVQELMWLLQSNLWMTM